MIEPLKIFYYNDTHGNSDQMSGLINSARNYKQQNDCFVLSGGDNYSGADVDKNSFIVDLMKFMDVDLSAIGNHELDGTSDGFYLVTKNKGFVATNVKYGSNNLMRQIPKSVIKEKNGIKYGFIGAMPLDFNQCSKKENQKDVHVMNFEDSVKSFQEEIDKLKEKGIDKIIMLSHSGYETDKKYASSLEGVDIIIGGHSHSLVNETVKSKNGEPVILVQAGENGKHFGILETEFKNGVVKKFTNKLFNANTSKDFLIEYVKDQKLGKSPVVTNINKIDPMPKNRRVVYCPWTGLMADSMKDQMKTDIAIINAANIRKVPITGRLTERDISESAPMKNDLLVTSVTEKQLIEAISSASKRTMSNEDGKPGLLIPSGFSYKINNKGDLLSMKIGGENIDINNPRQKIYSACYDIFVARGDGEYPEMKPMFDTKRFNFDKDKTTIDYLKGKDKVDVIDDDRLQIIKPLNILV